MESNTLKAYYIIMLGFFCNLMINVIVLLLNKEIVLNELVIFIFLLLTLLLYIVNIGSFVFGVVWLFKPEDEYEFNKLY